MKRIILYFQHSDNFFEACRYLKIEDYEIEFDQEEKMNTQNKLSDVFGGGSFRFLIPLALFGVELKDMTLTSTGELFLEASTEARRRIDLCITDYENDDTRRANYTRCFYTHEPIGLKEGMVIVPHFKKMFCIDPFSRKERLFHFENWEIVSKIKKIKRRRGKEQWCMTFRGARFSVPVDWRFFRLLSPGILN